MKKEKRTSQLIVRVTESEREFLRKKAEEENRTISAIVKGALGERYREFGEKKK